LLYILRPFLPTVHIDGGGAGVGFIWLGLYTSRDLVLVFESYNLSNISILTVHSCYTSSVHSYLRSILTAVVLGLVLSWFELYTSRDLVYSSRDLVYSSRDLVYTSRDLVLVFELYNLSNISIITVHYCYTSSVHSYLRSILTAVGLGLVLSWFELYTSIQPANAGDAPLAQEI